VNVDEIEQRYGRCTCGPSWTCWGCYVLNLEEDLALAGDQDVEAAAGSPDAGGGR